MPPRLLLLHGINYFNVGDLGIVDATIDRLREEMPDAEIRFVDPFLEMNRRWEAKTGAPIRGYSKPVGGVDVVPDFFQVPVPKAAMVRAVLRYAWLRVAQEVRRVFGIQLPWSSFLNHFQWADVVISKGGGFLLDEGKTSVVRSHLMTLSLAVHSPKPVVIYAQSIGPFKRRFSKWITAKVVKRAALVLPREEHSLAELRSMGVSESRIELTGDEAFCLRPEKEVAGQEEYAGAVGTSLRVGMAPRPWNFGYGPDQVLLTTKYRDSLVQTIDWLTGEKQATVYMVANFVSPSGDNDRLYIENELIPRLKRPDRVVQLPDLDARGLMRLYAGLDLFVGTRMHANIFALTAGTPTVAIAYLPKTTGIMEMLGLREQVILIDEINPETLQRVVDQVIRDRSALRHRIATAVQEMIVRSRRNALAVKELLQRRAA